MNVFIVDKDQLRPYGNVIPVPVGQSQFSQVSFRFSKDWDGLTKVAQFKQGDTMVNTAVSEDACIVPTELGVGLVHLRVRGYPENGDSPLIATANEVVIPMVQGFESGGSPAVPPTPDLYASLIKEIKRQSEKSPYIGEDGTWWEWDSLSESYQSSGVNAEGPKGDTGPQGPKGDDGSDYVLTDEDKAEIAGEVAAQTTQIESVDALPENPDPNVLYLIREEG